MGPDGVVLARLGPGAIGNGNMTLYDPAGAPRVIAAGAGAITIWDPDGTTITFRAGHSTAVGLAGEPPFNGVLLGPGGSITMLPPSP